MCLAFIILGWFSQVFLFRQGQMQSQKEEPEREGIESGGVGSGVVVWGAFSGKRCPAASLFLPPCRLPSCTQGVGPCSRGPGQSGGVAPGDVEGRCLWSGSRGGFSPPVRSMERMGSDA